MSTEGSTAAGAASAYSTPPRKTAVSAEAGPSRARPQGASPAYVRVTAGQEGRYHMHADEQSSRRHSLYGIEDRIVIDPGSRIWKVGFSGEADPRAVFWTGPGAGPAGELWDLDIDSLGTINRDEAERLVGTRVTRHLRKVFSKHLLTDAKSRKVIVLENAFLPDYIKQLIAQALFENLKVPSVSFTPSSLLALVACGRITGLVVDCGWLETTVVPVYFSRPLYHHARSTPLAGRSLQRRLTLLVRHFGTYHPPPTSLGDLTRHPVSPVPSSLVSDDLIERIITEVCFVSVSTPPPTSATDKDVDMTGDVEYQQLDELRQRYEPSSNATPLSFPITSASKGLGPGTLVVPGWIRERAAEVLFEEDEEDESESIPETVLQCFLNLPTDIRTDMASSILITGGTACLPGFIQRLRSSVKTALKAPHPGVPSTNLPLNTPAQLREEATRWRKRGEEPYRTIYGLASKIAILNDPSPLDPDNEASVGSSAGNAPRWVPNLLSWVGGSLAGALKTGAPETQREEYDVLLSDSISRGEQFLQDEEHKTEEGAAIGVDIDTLKPGEALGALGEGRKRRRGWKDTVPLGDWTRPGSFKTAMV